MNDTSYKIGMLGTGRMAINLSRLWAAKGHRIFIGSRDPQKAKTVAANVEGAVQGGSYRETAAFADVLALAIPWTAVTATLPNLGLLDGKILIDMTNPVEQTAVGMQLAIGHTTSFAEEIAQLTPGARVVKAYNSIYFDVLTDPQFGDQNASAFICGDDVTAKEVVAQLSQDIGFDPVDSGPLSNARLLEPLAVLWMQLAFSSHGTDIALKLLKR
jgi:NADPH-dependent F420 reductase